MLKYDHRTLLKTGDTVHITGYYVFDGTKSPNYGEIPAYPNDKERVIVLNEGDRVPPVRSQNNRDAFYRFVVEKRSTPLLKPQVHPGEPFSSPV